MKFISFIFINSLFISIAFGQFQKETNEILNWVDEYGGDNWSRSIDTLEYGLSQSRELKDSKSEVKFLLSLSRFFLVKLKNVSKCSEYLEAINQLGKKNSNDPWILSRYHNGRGVMYYYEDSDKKKAFLEFNYSQKIIRDNGLEDDPMLLNNYALAFLSNENADEALKLFLKGRDLEQQKVHSNMRFLITNAANIGVCYIYLNKPDSAEFFFREAVSLSGRTRHLSDDFHSMVYLGVFYEEEGKYEDALQIFDSAYQIIEHSGSLGTKALLFESYREIFKNTKDYRKALEYADLSNKYADSLRNLKLSEQAFAADYKLELDKVLAEQRISSLENSIRDQSARLRITLLTALLLFIIVFGAFIFYRLNKQKEVNRIKAENELLEKERIRQQAEIELLRKEEELVQANVELNVQKNEMQELKNRLQSHLDKSHDPEFDDLKHYLKQIQKTEKRADQLKYLDHVLSYSSSAFYSRLKDTHPNLTEDEMRLATLVRLNLSSDELIQVFNISRSSLMTKRYRMRKKLNLQKEESLEEYIMSL